MRATSRGGLRRFASLVGVSGVAGASVVALSLGRASADEPRYVPPLVHAAALMTTMRTIEWHLWPYPFARTQDFGAHWRDGFTHAPKFDASRRRCPMDPATTERQMRRATWAAAPTAAPSGCPHSTA